MSQTTLQSPFIRWFAEINLGDIPLVGGKNASLGEMYRALAAQGVRVPNGYAITAEAYRAFLRQSNLEQRIPVLLADLNTHDLANLRQRGLQVRQAIMAAPLPAELERAIVTAYDHLCAEPHAPVDSPSAAALQPKTSPMPALPGSRKRTSMSRALPCYSRPVSAASPRCSPIAPSPTGLIKASTSAAWCTLSCWLCPGVSRYAESAPGDGAHKCEAVWLGTE